MYIYTCMVLLDLRLVWSLRDTIMRVDQAHMMPETVQSLTVTDKEVGVLFSAFFSKKLEEMKSKTEPLPHQRHTGGRDSVESYLCTAVPCDD